MALTVDCTDPSALLKTYPCLACLSEKELKAVIVVAMAAANSQTVAEVLAASNCLNCLSQKQKLQSLAAAIGTVYLSDQTIDEIREDIKCLLCASDSQIESALLYEMCVYSEAR